MRIIIIRPQVEEEAEGIVLQGGEIPEVVLYDAINHLEKSGLELTPDERLRLHQAVAARYEQIIRRDLDTRNRCQSIFRGPKRARINLARLRLFSSRNGLDPSEFVKEASRAFLDYLSIEKKEISQGRAFNTLGMDREDTLFFMEELGLVNEPELAERVCAVPALDFEGAIRACRAERDRTGLAGN